MEYSKLSGIGEVTEELPLSPEDISHMLLINKKRQKDFFFGIGAAMGIKLKNRLP